MGGWCPGWGHGGPRKAIFSVKAGSACKKIRLAICGNSVNADAAVEGDTLCWGDTTAIRMHLKVGAERECCFPQ